MFHMFQMFQFQYTPKVMAFDVTFYDMYKVPHDTYQVTPDMWHFTHDT